MTKLLEHILKQYFILKIYVALALFENTAQLIQHI